MGNHQSRQFSNCSSISEGPRIRYVLQWHTWSIRKKNWERFLCLMIESSVYQKHWLKPRFVSYYLTGLGLDVLLENFWFCISYRIYRILLCGWKHWDLYISMKYFFLVVWYILKGQTWIPINSMHLFKYSKVVYHCKT